MARSSNLRRRPVKTFDPDDAFVALLIAAMDANGHVAADEAARAHDIIWSTRRFRHRSGEAVGRRIARVRGLIETHGALPIIHAAAQGLPKRLRQTAYAVAADLVLVDGRMERVERRFLMRLARDLGIDRERARTITDVIRLKNRA